MAGKAQRQGHYAGLSPCIAWARAIERQDATKVMIHFFQQGSTPKGPIALLYSSTSWGPSVQPCEPKRDISHLNPNMTLYHHSPAVTVRKNG